MEIVQMGKRSLLARLLDVVSVAISIIVGLAIGFGTFNGMADTAIIERLVMSIALAVVVGLALGYAWAAVIRIAEGGRHSVLAILCGLGLVLCSLGASTWFLATGLSGKDAMVESRLTHVRELQDTYRKIGDNAQIDEELLAATKSVRAELAEMAKGERNMGLVSGIAEGPGAWFRSIEAATATIGESVAEHEVIVARRGSLMVGAKRSLTALQKAAAEEDDAAFRKLALRTATVLDEASELKGIGKLSGLGMGLMGGEAKAQISLVFEQLRQLSADAENRWVDVKVPYYHPVSPQVATMRYAYAIPGPWLVALAVDVIPFVLLILVVVAHRQERRLAERGLMGPGLAAAE